MFWDWAHREYEVRWTRSVHRRKIRRRAPTDNTPCHSPTLRNLFAPGVLRSFASRAFRPISVAAGFSRDGGTGLNTKLAVERMDITIENCSDCPITLVSVFGGLVLTAGVVTLGLWLLRTRFAAMRALGVVTAVI